MKILLPLLVTVVLFVGCERIDGQLNVSKDINLKNTKGNTIKIRVGTYTADINANTDKRITFRLNNARDEKYDFNIPNGTLPTNGSFTYKSADVGQPVDLSGTVATVVTESGSKETTEACQYQEQVNVCYPKPNGGQECRTEMQTRFGTRWIQYFDKIIDKDVTISFEVASIKEEAAQFSGHANWIEKIVTKATICR